MYGRTGGSSVVINACRGQRISAGVAKARAGKWRVACV